MNIQKANQMFDDGTFTELFKAGFIGSKIFEYRQYYLFVHAQINTRKISINKAALEAEVKFNKGRSTIYRALAFFKM